MTVDNSNGNAATWTAKPGARIRVIGDPVWTCVGGLKPECAMLAVDGSALELSYDPPGGMIIFR